MLAGRSHGSDSRVYLIFGNVITLSFNQMMVSIINSNGQNTELIDTFFITLFI